MRYNRLHKDNNYLTPTTDTQTLSEYAVGLKYEDIPPEVVERAKMILLQTVGVSLAARNTDTAEKVRGSSAGPPGTRRRRCRASWRASTPPWPWAPSPTLSTGRTAPGPGTPPPA